MMETDGRQYQAGSEPLDEATRIAQETGQYDMTELSREQIERIRNEYDHEGLEEVCDMALAKKDAEAECERLRERNKQLRRVAGLDPEDAPYTPEKTKGPLTWADESIVDQFLSRDFEVTSYPDTDTVPDGWPEEWDEKPFARIRWAEDSGDPEAGMPGWSGFCLTVDQSGTVLGDILGGKGDE